MAEKSTALKNIRSDLMLRPRSEMINYMQCIDIWGMTSKFNACKLAQHHMPNLVQQEFLQV